MVEAEVTGGGRKREGLEMRGRRGWGREGGRRRKGKGSRRRGGRRRREEGEEGEEEEQDKEQTEKSGYDRGRNKYVKFLKDVKMFVTDQ